MKILIINCGPKPIPAVDGGGVETLIQFLIDKPIENIELTIASKYTQSAKKESSKFPHIKFVYLDFNSLLYKIQLLQFYFFNHFIGIDIGNALCNMIRRSVDLNQFDIIISENGVRIGKSLRKYCTAKIILHLHNDWLNTSTRFAESYKKSYNEIWTISKFLKQRVDDIPGDTDVKVLYNGVDTTLFNLSACDLRNESRLKYGISQNDIVIANCCRVVEEKGVLQTIKVFESLKYKFIDNNLKLLIIGDISSNDDYIKSLKKIASKDVIFTGYVDHDTLPYIMSCADVGIASTIHLDNKYVCDEYKGVIECFNLTVIEFLALGIPVIATNSGGMPEILNPEYNGYIIEARESQFANDLNNALIKILSTLNSINHKNKCLRIAEVFSKENYLKSFYKLIMELC